MLSLSSNTLPFLASFLSLLLNQIDDPSHKSHLDYQFPPDFLTEPEITFVNGTETPIESACESGPRGELPSMDYIIVGAGVAGSVLANKLATAFPMKTVLLIEAGGDGYVNSMSPGMALFSFNSEANYRYHAEQSPNYGNMIEDGTLTYAGKGLGGGSLINGMYFFCGHMADYDHWAEVTGDVSWNGDRMFTNIREFSNVVDESIRSDEECVKYLGTDGPLTVSSFNESNPAEELPILIKAGAAAGYEVLKDINCGKYKGFTQFRATIKGGERNSAARAFLSPMKNHRNLMILKNSLVKKVILTNGRVDGVLVQTSRPECPEFEVKANREVIISAGTFNSPGILLRSGIGRKADLDEINVEQELDLNVGHNYKDHFQSWHYLAVPASGLQPPQASDPTEDYLLQRKGPLSHLTTEDTHVFFNLNGDGPYPDLTWDALYSKAGEFDLEMFKYFANIKDKYFEVLKPWSVNHDLINIGNSILVPKSVGHVTTKDNRPVIHGNYNSHPNDTRLLIQGIRKLQEFLETPYLKDRNVTLVNMNLTECEVENVYDSDDYWKCYMGVYTMTSFHPVGTCRMGNRDDPNAVVDSTLKVIGANRGARLRVVDASVMPDVPSCNTMCPTYGVAWNAAKMIIAEHQEQDDESAASKVQFSFALAFLTVIYKILL